MRPRERTSSSKRRNTSRPDVHEPCRTYIETRTAKNSGSKMKRISGRGERGRGKGGNGGVSIELRYPPSSSTRYLASVIAFEKTLAKAIRGLRSTRIGGRRNKHSPTPLSPPIPYKIHIIFHHILICSFCGDALHGITRNATPPAAGEWRNHIGSATPPCRYTPPVAYTPP